MGDYEAWYDRGLDHCDEDIDCWIDFYHDSMAPAKTPETAERIRQGFLTHVLEKVLEHFKDIWIDEMGYDLQAWKELLERLDPDWRDAAAREIGRWLREEIREIAEAAMAEDPRARAHWRRYMGELLDDIVEGWLLGLTQREIAERTGYALHDIWNTTWWLRRYAGVELWPARE